VYAFIETDLLAAQWTTRKDSLCFFDIGRATKGAAKSFIKKCICINKKWQAVEEQCTAITGYELAADYATIWREVGEDTYSLKLEVMEEIHLKE
jgi:hypothetical protein